jgi:hypothetical protein
METMPKKKNDGKYRIKPRASAEQIKKTRRKSVIPKVVMSKVKTTPLVEFLIEHEKSGKTSRELVEEFRETCGHDFREVATHIVEGSRTTYQVCNTCGIFVKGKRGGKAKRVQTDPETQIED